MPKFSVAENVENVENAMELKAGFESGVESET
jgi:hypothetical protein